MDGASEHNHSALDVQSRSDGSLHAASVRTLGVDNGRVTEIPRYGTRGCGAQNGILIRMFFNDHPPPHFHARYGEFEATIDIGTLDVLDGQLPRRALNLVQEWAMIHREELLDDWRLCREKARPSNIEPLP